jgi:hypothetical protein
LNDQCYASSNYSNGFLENENEEISKNLLQKVNTMREMINSKLNEVTERESEFLERDAIFNNCYENLSTEEKRLYEEYDREINVSVRNKKILEDDPYLDLNSKSNHVQLLNFEDLINDLKLSMNSIQNNNNNTGSLQTVISLDRKQSEKRLSGVNSQNTIINLNEKYSLSKKSLNRSKESKECFEIIESLEQESYDKIDTLKDKKDNKNLLDRFIKPKDIKENQNKKKIMPNLILPRKSQEIKDRQNQINSIAMDKISIIHEKEILKNKDTLIYNIPNLSLKNKITTNYQNFNKIDFKNDKPYKQQVRDNRKKFTKSLNTASEDSISEKENGSSTNRKSSNLTNSDSSRFLNSGLLLEGVKTNKSFFLIRNKRMEQMLNYSMSQEKIQSNLKHHRVSSSEIEVEKNILKNKGSYLQSNNSIHISKDKTAPSLNVNTKKSINASFNANNESLSIVFTERELIQTPNKLSISKRYSHIEPRYNKPSAKEIKSQTEKSKLYRYRFIRKIKFFIFY